MTSFPEIRNFCDVFLKSAELIAAVEKNPATDIIYYLPNPRPGKINSEGKFVPFTQEVKDYKFEWCFAGSQALYTLTCALTYFAQKKKLTHCGNVKTHLVNQVSQLTGLQPGPLNAEDYLEFVSQNLARLFLTDKVGGDKVQQLIAKGGKKIFYGDFQPGDTDIFFLNSPYPHRIFSEGHDLVMSKAKSVEELLRNFDLPCCRVAYNVRRDFWVSAQCLYAMMKGVYPLPAYTTSPVQFGNLIMEHRNGDPMNKTEEFLVKRFAERIQKYWDRGFKPYYFETNQGLDKGTVSLWRMGEVK